MLNLNEVKACADQILTTFAQGFEIPSNRVGTFIAPIVPVKTRTGRVLRFDKSAFAVGDYRRAYGDTIKRVKSRFDSEPYALTQHTLGYDLPIEVIEEVAESPAAIDLRSLEIENVMTKLLNSHEIEVARAVSDIAKYETGLAFSTATAAGWSPWGSPTAVPIKNTITANRKISKHIAQRGNSMVVGERVYDELCINPDILSRVIYNSADAIDETVLAKYFGLKRGLRVAESKVLDKDTGDLVNAFPENGILLFYSAAAPNATVMPQQGNHRGKASFAYTYVLEGTPFVSSEYEIKERRVVCADTTYEFSAEVTALGNSGLVGGAMFIEDVLS